MIKFNFQKLNQLCLKITDGSHYSPIGIKFGIPMLSVKDMGYFGFSYSDCKYISEKDYFDLVKADCKPLLNDVLIAKDGSYLKHVFVIKKEEKQAILSSIGILRPNLKKISPDYLKYYLQIKSVKDTVSNKYVSGSALPRIILKNFGEISVIYKNLNEQQKIVSVLSAFDDKIELNNKINAELEEMAKTIYNYWFVQFDFPDKNGKPYKSCGGEMVWSEELKRFIPKDWEIKRLSDLLPVITGKKDANFATENGKYNFFTCGEEILKCDVYEFEGKAILVAGNGNFNIKLYEGKFNAYQRTYILIPSDERHYTLVYWAVRDRVSFLAKGSRGSIVKFITKGDIENIQIPLPKNKNLDVFYQLNIITKKIEKNILENQKLIELRDWLLPMLMNGQAEID